jgi:uncharacterized protein (DUF427 family)
MSLTIGGAPLSVKPQPQDVNYTLDGPKHRLFAQPFGRRVRAELGGETVLDTTDAVLVHESNLLPVLYVPREDVLVELTPTDHSTHCPFKGDASYWSIGDAENVVWGYLEPIVPWLTGLVAPYFDRMDAWWDEDEPIRGHVRDPYHRVDARRSSRPVTVTVGGREIASSSSAVLVAETGLAERWYLPTDDVSAELTQTETSTHCPYKGDATYWAVDGAADLAWSYEDPMDGCQALRGLVSFAGDDVEVRVG